MPKYIGHTQRVSSIHARLAIPSYTILDRLILTQDILVTPTLSPNVPRLEGCSFKFVIINQGH